MQFRKMFLVMVAALSVAIPTMAQDATAEATFDNVVNVSSSEALGEFFVDANGMTLYTFDRDTLNTSNCSGGCLENWPALTVESADAITADESIVGTWGTFTRDDGAIQVTYNGWPLYTWARDAAPGDTTGQAVGKVWWVAAPATVALVPTEMGTVLAGANGMTLYLFANDEAGVSNCADACAENWPPYTVESADDLVNGAGVGGILGTIERADGTLQVTYNEWPLYYWVNDAAVGDTTGHNVGDVWFAVVPETLVTAESEELGTYLTDANGFTLYTFANDEAGVSNCSDGCLEAWPAFTIADVERLSAGVGVVGEVAAIDRGDGVMQVTYNGMPLYYWQDDAAPGDTTGHNVGDVWFVAAP